MKLIRVAEENKRYYTKDFIHGFNTGAKTQYEADNKERLGWWEDMEHAPDGLLYVTCSVCGKRQTVEFTNYCGNCGARMEASE